MKINELKLTNFRGLLNTTITFKPGFNLIVGVNGSGKSSILEALRTLLSQALPLLAPAPRFSTGFDSDDIMIGRAFTSAQISFLCHDAEPYTYLVHKNEAAQIVNEGGSLRAQTTATPDRHALFRSNKPGSLLKRGPPALRNQQTQPLVLYFSVGRSIATDEVSKIGSKSNPAYFGAFTKDRGLRIQDLVNWWRVKEQIAKEATEGTSAKQLRVVKDALSSLLPHFCNWRLQGGDVWVTKTLVIEIPDAGSTSGGMSTIRESRDLQVTQLSDGERSLIAFVFDIARRLAQLNEGSDNPIVTGQGVVLIDEIDLHLHPAWQRRIVIDLPRVFPGLQFIATTHSPQVVGETPIGHAIVLYEGGRTEILDESLGRDSGWILRHVMDTPERNADFQSGLERIGILIGQGELESAKREVTKLRSKYGDDKELIAATSAIDRWELFGDEEDQ
jgi:predicted ATP-binding protein involved in virulence